MASTVDVDRIKEYNEEDTEEFADKIEALAALIRESRYTVFFAGGRKRKGIEREEKKRGRQKRGESFTSADDFFSSISFCDSATS